MLFWILTSCAAAFVFLTLLPLSRKTVWWIRGADFPRLQLTLLGTGLSAATFLMLDRQEWTTWIVIGATVAGVAYQAWWILPFTPFWPKEAKASSGTSNNERLLMMSINVLMTNRRADKLLQIVREASPDVLVTLETNAWWEDAMKSLEADYPHRLSCPLENLYGMHLYSRLPLVDPKIQFLVEPDVPSMHTLVKLPSGRSVCLHCLHPAPPSPTENPTSRERDAELVMVGRSASKARYPVIVSGDLNDVAWSATTRLFRKVSGLLDPRIGRGMFNTFHAAHVWARWPVDHFFHSKHFTVVRLARLAACGSDHFPVFVELEYAQENAADQEGLPADSSTDAEAREKMADEAVTSRAVHRPGES